jgi:hypothetical protein
MTDTYTIGQMHVRLSRYLPRELARAVSPSAIDKALAVAWVNGWRDPEWIANYALEGTENPNVREPAALFVSRLQDAANQKCPEIVTPEPPTYAEVMQTMHKGHTVSGDPTSWARKIREQLRKRPKGEPNA